jgi:hypothetical protein
MAARIKTVPRPCLFRIAHSGSKTPERFAGTQALGTLVVSGILCQQIHYETRYL